LTCKAQYDAVFLGIGLAGVNALVTKGEEVFRASTDAVDFIANLRSSSEGRPFRSAAASW
jgi:dihydropyrimidine dehydrogenase (NAD+) subunit PreT